MNRPAARRSRLGPFAMILALALAALAALYARCGAGFGFGDGAGPARTAAPGDADGAAAPPAAPERRPGNCQLRLDKEGLWLDGERVEREAAVAACRARDGADLVVTGDVAHGDAESLRAALTAAGVEVFRR